MTVFLVLSARPSLAQVAVAQPSSPPQAESVPSVIDVATYQGSSLSIGAGQTVVLDFGNSSALNLVGDITNSGQLYAVSSAPNVNVATFSAANITNSQGALFTTVLPAGGLPGLSSVSQLSLVLNALQNIVNAGTITSSGNLSLSAGGSIVNALPSGSTGLSPLIQAIGAVNLSSQTGIVTNAGSITSLTNNININSLVQTLLVNTAGGRLQALAGQINVSNLLGDSRISVVGGDFLSKELNLTGGAGSSIAANVNSISGLVNVTGCDLVIGTTSGGLNVSSLNLQGDPIIYSVADGVTLNLNGFSNLFRTNGADFIVLSGGDISYSGVASTVSAGAGKITLAAGVTFSVPGQPSPDPCISCAYSITGKSSAGGDVEAGSLVLSNFQSPVTLQSSAGTSSAGNLSIGSVTSTSGSITILADGDLVAGNLITSGSSGSAGARGKSASPGASPGLPGGTGDPGGAGTNAGSISITGKNLVLGDVLLIGGRGGNGGAGGAGGDLNTLLGGNAGAGGQAGVGGLGGNGGMLNITASGTLALLSIDSSAGGGGAGGAGGDGGMIGAVAPPLATANGGAGGAGGAGGDGGSAGQIQLSGASLDLKGQLKSFGGYGGGAGSGGIGGKVFGGGTDEILLGAVVAGNGGAGGAGGDGGAGSAATLSFAAAVSIAGGINLSGGSGGVGGGGGEGGLVVVVGATKTSAGNGGSGGAGGGGGTVAGVTLTSGSLAVSPGVLISGGSGGAGGAGGVAGSQGAQTTALGSGGNGGSGGYGGNGGAVLSSLSLTATSGMMTLGAVQSVGGQGGDAGIGTAAGYTTTGSGARGGNGSDGGQGANANNILLTVNAGDLLLTGNLSSIGGAGGKATDGGAGGASSAVYSGGDGGLGGAGGNGGNSGNITLSLSGSGRLDSQAILTSGGAGGGSGHGGAGGFASKGIGTIGGAGGDAGAGGSGGSAGSISVTAQGGLSASSVVAAGGAGAAGGIGGTVGFSLDLGADGGSGGDGGNGGASGDISLLSATDSVTIRTQLRASGGNGGDGGRGRSGQSGDATGGSGGTGGTAGAGGSTGKINIEAGTSITVTGDATFGLVAVGGRGGSGGSGGTGGNADLGGPPGGSIGGESAGGGNAGGIKLRAGTSITLKEACSIAGDGGVGGSGGDGGSGVSAGTGGDAKSGSGGGAAGAIELVSGTFVSVSGAVRSVGGNGGSGGAGGAGGDGAGAATGGAAGDGASGGNAGSVTINVGSDFSVATVQQLGGAGGRGGLGGTAGQGIASSAGTAGGAGGNGGSVTGSLSITAAGSISIAGSSTSAGGRGGDGERGTDGGKGAGSGAGGLGGSGGSGGSASGVFLLSGTSVSFGSDVVSAGGAAGVGGAGGFAGSGVAASSGGGGGAGGAGGSGGSFNITAGTSLTAAGRIASIGGNGGDGSNGGAGGTGAFQGGLPGNGTNAVGGSGGSAGSLGIFAGTTLNVSGGIGSVGGDGGKGGAGGGGGSASTDGRTGAQGGRGGDGGLASTLTVVSGDKLVAGGSSFSSAGTASLISVGGRGGAGGNGGNGGNGLSAGNGGRGGDGGRSQSVFYPVATAGGAGGRGGSGIGGSHGSSGAAGALENLAAGVVALGSTVTLSSRAFGSSVSLVSGVGTGELLLVKPRDPGRTVYIEPVTGISVGFGGIEQVYPVRFEYATSGSYDLAGLPSYAIGASDLVVIAQQDITASVAGTITSAGGHIILGSGAACCPGSDYYAVGLAPYLRSEPGGNLNLSNVSVDNAGGLVFLTASSVTNAAGNLTASSLSATPAAGFGVIAAAASGTLSLVGTPTGGFVRLVSGSGDIGTSPSALAINAPLVSVTAKGGAAYLSSNLAQLGIYNSFAAGVFNYVDTTAGARTFIGGGAADNGGFGILSGASVTLVSDNITIGAPIKAQAEVTLHPFSNNIPIGVAGGAGKFLIDAQALGRITSPVLTIGSITQSGGINLGSYSAPLSGAGSYKIVLTNAGAFAQDTNSSFSAPSIVVNCASATFGANAVLKATAGDITLNSVPYPSLLNVSLAAGAQLIASGDINLNPDSTGPILMNSAMGALSAANVKIFTNGADATIYVDSLIGTLTGGQPCRDLNAATVSSGLKISGVSASGSVVATAGKGNLSVDNVLAVSTKLEAPTSVLVGANVTAATTISVVTPILSIEAGGKLQAGSGDLSIQSNGAGNSLQVNLATGSTLGSTGANIVLNSPGSAGQITMSKGLGSIFAGGALPTVTLNTGGASAEIRVGSLSGTVTANGNVGSFVATTAISGLSINSVSATGDVTATAGNGDLFVNTLGGANIDFAVTGGGNLTANSILSSGNVAITNGSTASGIGGITIGGTGVSATAGSVKVSSGARGDITVNSAISASGSAVFLSGAAGNIALSANVTSGGSTELKSGNAVTNSISLATGNFVFSGASLAVTTPILNVSSSGALRAGLGDLTVQSNLSGSALSVNLGSGAALQSSSGNVGFNTTAGGAITMMSGFGKISAAGANPSVTFNGGFFSPVNVSVESIVGTVGGFGSTFNVQTGNGDLKVSATSTGGDFSARANQGNLFVNNLNASGSVTALSSNGNLTARNITSGAFVDLRVLDGGDLVVDSVFSLGAIGLLNNSSAAGHGGITVGGFGLFSAGSTVDVKGGGSGSLVVNGAIFGAGNVGLQSGGGGNLLLNANATSLLASLSLASGASVNNGVTINSGVVATGARTVAIVTPALQLATGALIQARTDDLRVQSNGAGNSLIVNLGIGSALVSGEESVVFNASAGGGISMMSGLGSVSAARTVSFDGGVSGAVDINVSSLLGLASATGSAVGIASGQGDLNFGVVSTANGATVLSALGGRVTIAGAISSSGGSVDITGVNGVLISAPITNTTALTNGINIGSAKGAISINADVNSNSAVSFQSAGSITRAQGLVTGSIASFTSSSGTIGSGAQRSASNVFVDTSTVRFAGTSASITSKGSIALGDSSLGASGVLILSTQNNGNLDVSGTLSAGANSRVILSADGGGNISTSNIGGLAASAVEIESGFGQLGTLANPLLLSTSNLRLSTGGSGNAYVSNKGNVVLGDSVAGGTVSVLSTGSVSSTSDIRSSSLSLVSDKDVTVKYAAALNGDLIITAGRSGSGSSKLHVLPDGILLANEGNLQLNNIDIASGTIVIDSRAVVTARTTAATAGQVQVFIGNTYAPVPGPTPVNVTEVNNSGFILYGSQGIKAIGPENFIVVSDGLVGFNQGARPDNAITLNGGTFIASLGQQTPVVPLSSLDLSDAAVVSEIQTLQQTGHVGGKLTYSSGALTGNVIISPTNLFRDGGNNIVLSAENIVAGVGASFRGFSALDPVNFAITSTSTTKQIVVSGTHEFAGSSSRGVLNITSDQAGPSLLVSASGRLTSAGSLSITANGDMLIQGHMHAQNLSMTTTNNGNISVEGIVTAGSTASLAVAGTGNITSIFGVLTSPEISLIAAAGNISVLTSASKISFDSTGKVSLANFGSDLICMPLGGSLKEFSLTNDRSVTISGAIDVRSGTNGGTISVLSAGRLIAGALTASGAAAGGSVLLVSGAQMDVGNISVNGDNGLLSMISGSSISAGNLTADGMVGDGGTVLILSPAKVTVNSIEANSVNGKGGTLILSGVGFHLTGSNPSGSSLEASSIAGDGGSISLFNYSPREFFVGAPTGKNRIAGNIAANGGSNGGAIALLSGPQTKVAAGATIRADGVFGAGGKILFSSNGAGMDFTVDGLVSASNQLNDSGTITFSTPLCTPLLLQGSGTVLAGGQVDVGNLIASSIIVTIPTIGNSVLATPCPTCFPVPSAPATSAVERKSQVTIDLSFLTGALQGAGLGLSERVPTDTVDIAFAVPGPNSTSNRTTAWSSVQTGGFILQGQLIFDEKTLGLARSNGVLISTASSFGNFANSSKPSFTFLGGTLLLAPHNDVLVTVGTVGLKVSAGAIVLLIGDGESTSILNLHDNRRQDVALSSSGRTIGLAAGHQVILSSKNSKGLELEKLHRIAFRNLKKTILGENDVYSTEYSFTSAFVNVSVLKELLKSDHGLAQKILKTAAALNSMRRGQPFSSPGS